ncbi:PQQ-dependent sugar dehydrogenase [Natrinema salaciae]|uniref:Copper binding protein, plastocyanin/azurin family n=1 Tax=Natrinema salaciae TaxID=1186196 RepID=A0A1H9BQS7_9EURY|nr:PQQ-dependent sugar dehydrogenase [Natrinema salaciae]SEP91157.1 Copper binding protein, plastocyanin/azurin family [Natrinema salaciae]
MSEQPDERSIPVPPSSDSYPSRRRVLQAAAAAGGVAALGGVGLAQETETIELGGETSGWQGVAPDDIEGETNPTLELEEGTTYEVTWENLDGLPHNFVIESEDGEELERTELLSVEGETQTLEFEATSEMATYYCVPHSATMRGDISVGGGGGATQAGSDGERQSFFDEGPEIGLQTVAEGMTAPTDMAVAGEEQDRYYVADQTGELWVVTDEGLQDEPFLDVSDRMVELGTFQGEYADPESEYDERGLLGVEFHPEFAENGRFFVHYSAPPNGETPNGWSHVEVVSEFQAEDTSRADPESERVLMEFQKPQYNHDAGPMAFGPDGYLYVPMGDGGGANDDMLGHVDDWYDGNAGGNGQDVSENLLGGIHRIDVDSEGEDRPYGIPDDNPLVGEEDGLDEYYAWGMRNPFGITFDSDGRLFSSDAGQNLFEEVNLVEAGGNYGWNVKEGTHCFSTDSPSEPPEDCPDAAPDEPPYDGQELQDPIVEYPHVYGEQTVGITVIGGHVYEAGDVGDLEGKYVFGDWTADPARQSPDGTLIAASEPDDGGDRVAGDADGNVTDAMNATDGNATDENATDGNATDEMNATDGNATDGNATAADAGSGGQADGEVVPRDELWDMEELQVAGTEDGSFPYFVRQFGQDADGNVYVLANQVGVPEGDTGAVMQIVPPGEGDSLSPPEEGDVGGGDGEGNETDGGANETANQTEIEDEGFGNESENESGNASNAAADG